MTRDKFAEILLDYYEKHTVKEFIPFSGHELADLLIQAIPEITGFYIQDEIFKRTNLGYLFDLDVCNELASEIMKKIKGEG